jgi:hypothetical protein
MKARLDRAESVSQAAVPASSALAKPASLGQVASLTPVVPKAPHVNANCVRPFGNPNGLFQQCSVVGR